MSVKRADMFRRLIRNFTMVLSAIAIAMVYLIDNQAEQLAMCGNAVALLALSRTLRSVEAK